jgi:hypothetical protein
MVGWEGEWEGGRENKREERGVFLRVTGIGSRNQL